MRSDQSPPPSTRLGAAARARRRDLGLSQAALCDLAGVGPAFLYQLERGKPTLRLDKLLAVLEVLGLEFCLRPGKATLVVEGLPDSDGV
jgi:y4mF family transcriptional regulator